MVTASEFEVLVERYFAFLETDNGFRRDPVESSGREHYVQLHGPVRVTVNYEVGTGTWVSVWAPVPSPPHQATTFSLDQLIKEMESRTGKRFREASIGTTVAEHLENQANLLREIGGDILSGNVSIMVARQERLWNAVRGGA